MSIIQSRSLERLGSTIVAAIIEFLLDDREIVIDQRRISFAQFRKFRLHVLELVIRHFVEDNESRPRAFYATQKFIQL
jgi:hypothetical protein